MEYITDADYMHEKRVCKEWLQQESHPQPLSS